MEGWLDQLKTPVGGTPQEVAKQRLVTLGRVHAHLQTATEPVTAADAAKVEARLLGLLGAGLAAPLVRLVVAVFQVPGYPYSP